VSSQAVGVDTRGWDGSAVGAVAREARRGDVGSAVGRRAAVGMDTRCPDSAFKVWRGMWQPSGDNVLAGGSSVERGRLTSGSHLSAISELKFTPEQKQLKINS
jgi:hypothetical protein